MSYVNNLKVINQRITTARDRAKRFDEDVSLAAVSKTVDASVIRKVYDAGQRVFAENRPQVLRDKNIELSELDIDWHYIGPLQTNKIKYVYPIVKMVHSVDRESLIESFAQWAVKTDYKCPFLLEVHISDETSKKGFAPDEILSIIEKYRNHPQLDIRGLMGMAPFVDDQNEVRKSFAKLSSLLNQSKALEGTAYKAQHLSMGMTNDFEIAIEEGATIVRVGSAIFSGKLE